MKSILLLFIFLTIQDQDIISYKAECNSMTDDGLVTFQIWDIKSKKKYKIEQAEKDAVQYILYEGFRNKSCGYVSPLLKSYELKYEFEDSDMYFFSIKKGSYSNYVVSSKESISIKDDWKVYEVVINKKLLDEYLVEKGIKQKIDIY